MEEKSRRLAAAINVELEIDEFGMLIVSVDTGQEIKREYIELEMYNSHFLDLDTERFEQRKIDVRLPAIVIKDFD